MSAVVSVYKNNAKPVQARMLLDTASTASFVTESFPRSLNLKLEEYPMSVGALN